MERSDADRVQRKLARLRQSPRARLVVLQGPEARAGHGILVALDRALGLIKRMVPHRVAMTSLQAVLMESKAVAEAGRQCCERYGLVVGWEPPAVGDLERALRSPAVQVFVPHHEETQALCAVLTAVNAGCVQARARLSADECETDWFDAVMDWLRRLDAVAAQAYAVLERREDYTSPRLVAGEAVAAP